MSLTKRYENVPDHLVASTLTPSSITTRLTMSWPSKRVAYLNRWQEARYLYYISSISSQGPGWVNV